MHDTSGLNIDSDSEAVLAKTLSFFDAINRHDGDAVVAHFHPDVHYRFILGAFPEARGKAAVAEAWTGMVATFPDVNEELVEVIVRGDIAIAHWVLTGTLSGPLPLGSRLAVPQGAERNLAVRGVDVLHFRDGLILRKDSLLDPSAWFENYATQPFPAQQDAAE